MSKSIAELRASSHTSRPERAYSLCLAAGLVAEVQALTSERDSLVPVRDESGKSGPPRRMAEGDPTRAVEIQKRLTELFDEMDEHTGELRVRAIDNGSWRRWVDEHPAREENIRDDTVTFGLCNADDLIDDLGMFAVSWNGDPLGSSDWEFIADKASLADLKQIAALVVTMHELAANLPKLRSVSLGNPSNESA